MSSQHNQKRQERHRHRRRRRRQRQNRNETERERGGITERERGGITERERGGGITQRPHDVVPNDFIQVYGEFLSNLQAALPNTYRDLLTQRQHELQNPSQARVLYEDFKTVHEQIVQAIVPRDETAILRSAKPLEFVRGIDFRELYPTLSDTSRNSFWMFLQILSFIIGNQHSALWDNIMRQAESLYAATNNEDENGGDILQHIQQLCGLNTDENANESEKLLSKLITNVTEKVMEDPMAVFQSLQQPQNSLTDDMMVQLLDEQMHETNVNPEELLATIQNMASSIEHQMPDVIQSLMATQTDSETSEK